MQNSCTYWGFEEINNESIHLVFCKNDGLCSFSETYAELHKDIKDMGSCSQLQEDFDGSTECSYMKNIKQCHVRTLWLYVHVCSIFPVYETFISVKACCTLKQF